MQYQNMELDVISNMTLSSLNSLLIPTYKESESLLRNMHFECLFIARMLYKDTNKLCIMNGDELLNKTDIDRIKTWLMHEEKFEFKDGYYRIDLDSHILMTKLLNYEIGVVLIGHLLKRNTESRIMLLEMRNKYLAEQLQ